MNSASIGHRCAIVVLLFAVAGANADPTGVAYDIVLDLVNDEDFVVEGHAPPVGSLPILDTTPDLVPYDGTETGALPGNDLIVTTTVSPVAGGEFLELSIAGQLPLAVFPTPGADLFVNPPTPGDSVWLGIGAPSPAPGGLFWPAMPTTPGAMSLEFVALGFGGPPVPVPLIGLGTLSEGAGTAADPLAFTILFPDAMIFLGSAPATDLHVEFFISHVPVPAPFVLLASAVAALGFVGLRRHSG